MAHETTTSPLPIINPDDWNQQPGEAPHWFNRFEIYRTLGPSRSIEKAFQTCRQLEGLAGRRPSPAWYINAQQFHWQDRAFAWDRSLHHQRQKQKAAGQHAASDNRLEIIDYTIRLMVYLLRKANLQNLTERQARQFLPIARTILRDMIREHRLEIGLPAHLLDDDPDLPAFTADDFLKATKELTQWQQTHFTARDE
jgi:hypothetical protein